MVTENEGHRFLLKMDSVGPKLHQISPKKLHRVYNIYAIVLQFYIHCCEVLCSCSGQDSYERDKDTARDMSKFKCRSARSARSNCFACSAVSDRRDAYCRSRTLKIFVTFCDKDGQHIPSSIAWAQHLKATNVALEHNSICIINSTEFFRRD